MCALLAFLCAAGCANSEASTTSDTTGKANPSAAASSVAGTAENASESSVTTAQPEAANYRFSLGFAGDLCLADNYLPMEHLAQLGSTDISDGIDPVFIQIMRKMDLMWINNEFVYSDRGEPLEGKAWTFKGSPANVKYLNDLGIDIVGLANNHVFDYGEEAFMDTLETLEGANIPYVGAGRNLAAATGPVYLKTNGFTIAYVNACSAEYTIYTPEATETEPGILWSYDRTRFLEAIREAAEHADYVVALPHWGTEHTTMLIDEQLVGARELIDAGADAVVGAHTHVMQGIEYYNGKPILYSLGNFWFDDYDIDTLVAELRISGNGTKASGATLDNAQVELVIHPGTQSGIYTSYADTPEERDRLFRYIESISIGIEIDENGIVHDTSAAAQEASAA